MAARREILKNNPQTTIAEDLDASETTVTVTDGSVFPSTGNFRVIVNNELMLVTARSGNDLTVERGAEGTGGDAHTTGDDIIQILTEDGFEAYVRDNVPYHNYSRSPYRIIDSSGNVLDSTDFTKTDGTTATTPVDQGGRIHIQKDSSSANPDYTLMRRTAPATPCVLVAAFQMSAILVGTGSRGGVGLFFRESSTGEFVVVELTTRSDMGLIVDVRKMASATAQSGVGAAAYYVGSGTTALSLIMTAPEIWFRIEDNGTNLIFKIGFDGINWQQLHSVSRTDLMAGGPDEWGFCVFNENNTTWDVFGTLLAYDEGAT